MKNLLGNISILLLGITAISVPTLIIGFGFLPVMDIILGLPLLWHYIRSTQLLSSYKHRKILLSSLWIILHSIQQDSVIVLSIEKCYGGIIPLLSNSFITKEQSLLSNIFSDYTLFFFNIFPPISLLLFCIVLFWLPALQVIAIDSFLLVMSKIYYAIKDRI